jgi:prephenate dehydrogenase
VDAPILDCVAIVGVGLIGGSVALGLKRRGLCRHLIGLDAQAGALTTALALGVIDEGQLEVGPWLRQADLVVLAVPVGLLSEVAGSLLPWLRSDALLTDVGSVKVPLSRSLSLEGFVPGHPLAGSERAGVEHARANLIENAIWVLTPTEETSLSALGRIRELVEALGASPVVMPPEAHDQLVATISHLPYLTALALTHMVARDERLALLAAGGFRDITRVASGDPVMSRDMVINNKQALRDALNRFQRELDRLNLQLDQPEVLLASARAGKATRDSLPVVRRSLLPALHDLIVAVEDRPGELGRITQLLGQTQINIKDIEMLAIRDQGGAIRLGLESPEQVALASATLAHAGYTTRSLS